jgi:hypothetical protein
MVGLDRSNKLNPETQMPGLAISAIFCILAFRDLSVATSERILFDET